MTKCILTVLHIVLLATLASLCVDCGDLNCSDRTEQSKTCASRFDMLEATMALVNPTGNCSRVKQWYCMCRESTLKVVFFEFPPYIFVDTNGTVDGIIPGLLNIAIDSCCFGCTNIIYRKPLRSIKELISVYYNSSYFDVFLPANADKNAERVFGDPFVKLFTTPGFEFIHLDNESKLVMNKLMGSLTANWSLLAIGLILTVHAGVIIWMLDSHKNPDEFPSCFLSGILEGSWWAYISMTTVGYGDKAPKSQIGRLFSVIWITMGVVLVALFTASLTSAMTSALLSEKTKLDGKTIGIPRFAELVNFQINPVQRDGGTPVEYKNISSMMKDLNSKKIDGILMDKLMLRYYWKEIESFVSKDNAIIVKEDVPNSDTAIGLEFKSNQWAEFLKEFFASNKDADRRMQLRALQSMKNKLPNPSIPRPVTSNPFNSPVIYKKLLSEFGVSCVIILAIGCGFAVIKKFLGNRLLCYGKICSVPNLEDGMQIMTGKPDQLEIMQRKIEESMLKEIKEQFDKLRADTRQVGMSININPAEDVSKC
eukprot:gene19205-21129_t